METTPMENNQKETNPLKKWVMVLGILAGVFFVTTIYFAFFGKPVANYQYVQTVNEKDQLQAELNSLMAEHNRIKEQYEDVSGLLSEKDSIIMANAEEIKALINSQADYRKIKKQLARLQNIAKEYVSEIDKLYTENQALKEENTQVKETLAQTQLEKEAMAKDNEDLNSKINAAAVLKAYNIKGSAVYYKSKGTVEVITDRASKVEKFKTTLTLAENSLAAAGPVNIYCRVAIPGSGKVLTPGAADAYTFMNEGQRLQYTAKAVVNYTGQAENVVLFWDLSDNDRAIKGQYVVQVFTDDHLLGETYFTLN